MQYSPFEEAISDILASFPSARGKAATLPDDSQWVNDSFMLGDNRYTSDAHKVNKHWSSASRKFTSSAMGMSIGVGARPQACRYGDPRLAGRFKSRNKVGLTDAGGNYGMGFDYSERIDDHERRLYVRFGVPQFNSLTRFFSMAFDPATTTLVNEGRAAGKMYNLGQIVGTVVSVMAYPIPSLLFIGLKQLSSIVSRPNSQFYSLKPTMPLYWSTVNHLLNTIAIFRGVYPRIPLMKTPSQQRGARQEADSATLTRLHELMPDIFSSTYALDAMAIANRAQRVYNAIKEEEARLGETMTAEDVENYMYAQNTKEVEDPPGGRWLVDLIKNFMNTPEFGEQKGTIEKDARYDKITGEPLAELPNSLVDHYKAERAFASEFAVFMVEKAESSTISFDSTAKESDLSLKFNGNSAAAREMNFSFAGGNIGDNIVADAFEAAIGGLKDVSMGFLSGITLGVSNALVGLIGGGYLNVPKHWDNSSVTFPTVSYKRRLITPYNNPISCIQNLDLYISMLIAGAAPRATGSQSYSSPFLAQVFDRGINQAKICMLTKLDIERGTGNLGFDEKMNALAIDVTFTFTDFSSVFAVPISTGGLFSTDLSLDEDNALYDFLAVHTGMGLDKQFYTSAKAELAIAMKQRKASYLTSRASWAASANQFLHDWTPVGFYNNIVGAQTSTLSLDLSH